MLRFYRLALLLFNSVRKNSSTSTAGKILLARRRKKTHFKDGMFACVFHTWSSVCSERITELKPADQVCGGDLWDSAAHSSDHCRQGDIINLLMNAGADLSCTATKAKPKTKTENESAENALCFILCQNCRKTQRTKTTHIIIIYITFLGELLFWGKDLLDQQRFIVCLTINSRLSF